MKRWVSLLDRLWRILGSPRLTVILLVWVAALFAFSEIIPQSPPRVQDPIARSQWLVNIPIVLRPLVEWLQPLGVFDLLGSTWLRLPLVLLLAHTMVMLAVQGPAIWHRLRWSIHASRVPGAVSSTAKPLYFNRNWSGPVEHVGQVISSQMEKAGYHVLPLEDQGENQKDFIFSRWKWGWLGLIGFYLGIGLASLGLVLGSWLDRTQEITLVPDDLVPFLAVGDPTLELDAVTVAGGDPLSVTNGIASIRMVTGVGESEEISLSLHGSRLFWGKWMTLVELRPVAEVIAAEITPGENVLLQPFSPRAQAQKRARLSLIGDPETRSVGVPSKNLALHVDYRADKDQHQDHVFYLSFLRGADPNPIRLESLASGDEVSFEGTRYRVTFGYDAVLRVNGSLWWVMVGLGWGSTALSLILLVVTPPVYGRGQIRAGEQGSLVMLVVDSLGDSQLLHRKLGDLVSSHH